MCFHKYKTIHKYIHNCDVTIQISAWISIIACERFTFCTRGYRVTDMQVLISSFMVRRQRAILDILSSL